MQVTVYTTTTCPYCKMLKGYLAEKGVQYTEKLTDQNVAAQEEMMKLSEGFMGVPFTVVTKDDGSVVKIRGFDKEKVDETLGLGK